MLDMVKELEKTLHIHSADLPWVKLGPGTESRLLMARPEEKMYAFHLRAQPYVKSGLHKHHNAVVGFTLAGIWGHDDRYLYRPGTFIFETPGVVHQFVNGPEVAEVIFIGDPNLDYVDPETLDVTTAFDGFELMNGYIAMCEAQGITPHFLR